MQWKLNQQEALWVVISFFFLSLLIFCLGVITGTALEHPQSKAPLANTPKAIKTLKKTQTANKSLAKATKTSALFRAAAPAKKALSPDAEFYLHVATFRDKGKALTMKNWLQNQKIRNVSLEAYPKKSDRPMYRVQMGPYISNQQAKNVADRLSSGDVIKDYIIRKATN